MDRRDFLLGFTATGAVTTTKVATAKEIDRVISRRLAKMLVVDDVPRLDSVGEAAAGELAIATDKRYGGCFVSTRSNEAVDGAVVVGHPHAANGFRWIRSYSGMPSLSWWKSPADAFAWAKADSKRPVSFFVPKGIYDFSGMEVPLGISFFGDGAGRSGGDEGAVFVAGGDRVVQAPGADRFQVFQGLSFPNGLEIRKQHTRLQDCLVDGKGLWLEGDGYSPYHIVVDNCRLYAAPGYDCVTLNKTVNACTFSNNEIATRGGRCVYIRSVSGLSGSMNTFMANAIEHMYMDNVTSVPCFVRCDGSKNTFIGNYIDTSVPIFTEGGAFVFGNNSTHNRVFPSGQKTETFAAQGSAPLNRTERTGPELFRKAGGTLSVSAYEAQYYVVDAATTGGVDLPSAANAFWATKFFVLHVRDAPQVVRANGAEDINYSGNSTTVPADTIVMCVPHGGVRWLLTVIGHENGDRTQVDDAKTGFSYTTRDQDSGKFLPIDGIGSNFEVIIHRAAQPGFRATFRQAGPAVITVSIAGGVGTILHVDGHRRSRGRNSLLHVLVEANGTDGPMVVLSGDTSP